MCIQKGKRMMNGGACGVRMLGILLANGTVQGAVATWRLREQLLTSPPGRYRSLYRTIRQQNPKHPHSKGCRIILVVAFISQRPSLLWKLCFLAFSVFS